MTVIVYATFVREPEIKCELHSNRKDFVAPKIASQGVVAEYFEGSNAVPFDLSTDASVKEAVITFYNGCSEWGIAAVFDG